MDTPQNFNAEALPVTEHINDDIGEGVQWQASEYLHHQKSIGWYALVTFVLFLVGIAAYLVTHDYFGPFAVVILGALLLVAAGRKPRLVDYLVDQQGIVIGNKEYAYDEFQSFAVVREDAVESILLTPLKKLMPSMSLYFGPNESQRIFNVLSTYLPLEDRKKDPIDRFLHKIRF